MEFILNRVENATAILKCDYITYLQVRYFIKMNEKLFNVVFLCFLFILCERRIVSLPVFKSHTMLYILSKIRIQFSSFFFHFSLSFLFAVFYFPRLGEEKDRRFCKYNAYYNGFKDNLFPILQEKIGVYDECNCVSRRTYLSRGMKRAAKIKRLFIYGTIVSRVIHIFQNAIVTFIIFHAFMQYVSFYGGTKIVDYQNFSYNSKKRKRKYSS